MGVVASSVGVANCRERQSPPTRAEAPFRASTPRVSCGGRGWRAEGCQGLTTKALFVRRTTSSQGWRRFPPAFPTGPRLVEALAGYAPSNRLACSRGTDLRPPLVAPLRPPPLQHDRWWRLLGPPPPPPSSPRGRRRPSANPKRPGRAPSVRGDRIWPFRVQPMQPSHMAGSWGLSGPPHLHGRRAPRRSIEPWTCGVLGSPRGRRTEALPLGDPAAPSFGRPRRGSQLKALCGQPHEPKALL